MDKGNREESPASRLENLRQRWSSYSQGANPSALRKSTTFDTGGIPIFPEFATNLDALKQNNVFTISKNAGLNEVLQSAAAVNVDQAASMVTEHASGSQDMGVKQNVGLGVDQSKEMSNDPARSDTNVVKPSSANVSVAEGAEKNKESPIAHVKSNDPAKNPSVSFADALNKNVAEAKKPVNFRKVDVISDANGVAEVMIPLSSVQEVSNRLCNSVYGYFIGKRVAYPVVESYVKNSWAKFGLQKVMMNSRGFFFFKFASEKGVQEVLSGGPWMIRNIPIILNKWTPTTNVTKNDHSVVPVWVKFHDVPLPAFTEDGLSAISSRVGNPKMLDAYTSEMCTESWGRSSFARAMIEISATSELKEEVIVGVPNIDGKGHVCETIRVEYEWKPPHCLDCKLFGHGVNDCPKRVVPKATNVEAGPNADGFQAAKGTAKTNHFKPFRGLVVGNKKKVGGGKPKQIYVPKKTPKEGASTSNSFDLLNKLDDDGNLPKGNKADSKEVKEDMKKKKIEIREDDSESDVETIFDESRGFGSQNLHEAWNEEMEDDFFEDEDYNAYDLSNDQLAFCEAFDIESEVVESNRFSSFDIL